MSLIRAAMEAIEFQSTDFGDEVTAQFQALLDAKLKPADAQKHPAVKEIAKLAKKYTGISVNLVVDTEDPPCTRPVFVNPNTPLMQEFVRGWITDDHNMIMNKLERDNKNEGMVNLKKGTVSGVLSEIECPIWMAWSFMQQLKFTADECAAIFMHELGHNFVNFEFLARTVSANQILVASTRALDKSGPEEYKLVLKRAGKVLEDDPEHFGDLTEVTDKRVIVTAVLTTVLQSTRSETGTKNYDNTTYEALSDNYATRQGLGRALVTGLDRLARAYGFPEYSQAARITAGIGDIIRMFLVPILGVLAIPAAIAMGSPLILISTVVMMLMGASEWILSGDNYRDRTYDDLFVRFRRIREQEVELLKIRNLDPKTAKRALANIKEMDETLKDVKEHVGLSRTLSNLVIGKNRKEKAAVEIQRKLEELSANDIFAKAAQLRGV